GIIGADRNNGFGTDGICNGVKIMCLRTIPEGESLDKDVSNAIRYAVNNGAKVINISACKFSSPQRSLVDQSVKYAMDNDVLIVHAAGNNGVVLTDDFIFPNKKFSKGGVAENWIEVGASRMYNDSLLVAPFSNYGKNFVDVFAPGENIYSTWYPNSYSYQSGTSMAAPIVSGIAAVLRAYYPDLSAVQTKKLILQSVQKIQHSVIVNGERVNFSDLCLSGGIVNLYNALLLAEKEAKK
ncbi:MAG: S8 family serine peptidase, partial [Pedobacter sp.]|nr:S8 family serine peptidase [Pedobacter sp.]